jgi:hypothetical protein
MYIYPLEAVQARKEHDSITVILTI